MKRLGAMALALTVAAFAPQLPIDKNTPNPSDATKESAMTVLNSIRAHLIDKHCWTDHSDMPEARRLRATFRVSFGRNGRFSRLPELISPKKAPANDPAMTEFITYAQQALTACNALGWPIPPEYFELSDPPPPVDIEFMPKVPAPAG